MIHNAAALNGAKCRKATYNSDHGAPDVGVPFSPADHPLVAAKTLDEKDQVAKVKGQKRAEERFDSLHGGGVVDCGSGDCSQEVHVGQQLRDRDAVCVDGIVAGKEVVIFDVCDRVC